MVFSGSVHVQNYILNFLPQPIYIIYGRCGRIVVWVPQLVGSILGAINLFIFMGIGVGVLFFFEIGHLYYSLTPFSIDSHPLLHLDLFIDMGKFLLTSLCHCRFRN